MGENYRITITDPLSNIKEYYFMSGNSNMSVQAHSWYTNPKNYSPYENASDNNYANNVPSTKYDYFRRSSNTMSDKFKKITSPEGNYTEYEYYFDGTLKKKIDSHGHSTSFTYNTKGRVLTETDAMGSTTTYDYYSNSL